MHNAIKQWVFRHKLAVTIVSALCVVLLYLFLPVFQLKHIVILGNVALRELDLPRYSDEPTDKNIYLIRTNRIEQDFLKSPYIKSIQIRRQFPRTLVYQITERKAVATIKFTGGFAIIDDFGTVLATTQNISEIVKPLINGAKIQEIVVGEELKTEDMEKLRVGLDALSNVKSAQLLNHISQIDIQDPKNMHMITPQGIVVLLGEGKDLNEKMRVLNKILIDLFERKIYSGYVDMRYDAYPVYRSSK